MQVTCILLIYTLTAKINYLNEGKKKLSSAFNLNLAFGKQSKSQGCYYLQVQK